MNNTVEQVIDRDEIRRRLKAVSREDFIRAHTKSVLTEMATTMGVEEPSGTKDELYDLIWGNASMPNPALRGASSISNPVSFVHTFLDEHREQIASGEMRRVDAVNALKAEGVAHYTARTQYQKWFELTGKGSRALADIPVEELPRALRPEPEADDESSDEG